MSRSVSVPEKVAERKIIVYKPRVDSKQVRATSERMKTRLFRKFVFIKPKPEEVQIVSIDKYYEPYVVVDGEYIIDYSKKWSHNIQVDETMQELTFFGEKITPVSLMDHLATPCKIVTLNGIGRLKFEAKERLIFDSKWQQIGLEELPFVPFEEQPEKALSTVEQNPESFKMSDRKEVELLKSLLVKRPSDILTIHKELFTVFDRAVVYKPMYKVIFKNIKTKKEAMLLVDAITGKTKIGEKQVSSPERETVKEPQNPTSDEETTIAQHFSLLR